MTYLLLQFELAFGVFLPRGLLGPDLDSQLFGRQGFPEEARRLHLVHADGRKRIVLGSHVLDDRVGLEDIGSNIVSVGPICRIEGPPVKETNCPSLRRFWRKCAEERAESGVDLF